MKRWMLLGPIAALVGMSACANDNGLGDAERLSLDTPAADAELKSVWEFCDECWWYDHIGTDPADPDPDAEGGEEYGEETAGNEDGTEGTGGTGGSDDGGGDDGGFGYCVGYCPARDFGGVSVQGECTEVAPEDCRCLYEVPRDELKIKVLVTGFGDWGYPGATYRLQNNPSGLLLTGNTSNNFRNEAMDGPLPDWLQDNADETDCGIEIEYEFRVLPVLWGIADQKIDYCKYDFVINIGVGGPDPGKIDLEKNAKNERSQDRDADGQLPPLGPIDPNSGPTIEPNPRSGVNDRIDDQDGTTVGDFEVDVKEARDDNCFICNETNGTGLRELNEGQGECATDCEIDGVHFIHVPSGTDQGKLAEGVGELIDALVQPYGP